MWGQQCGAAERANCTTSRQQHYVHARMHAGACPATLLAHLAASSEKSTGQLQQTAHPSPSISSSCAELGYRPSASHSSSHSRAPLVARPAGRGEGDRGSWQGFGVSLLLTVKDSEKRSCSNSRAIILALAPCAPTHLSPLRWTGLPGMPAPAHQSPAPRPPGQHAGLAARSCCLPQRQAGGAVGTAPAASQITGVSAGMNASAGLSSATSGRQADRACKRWLAVSRTCTPPPVAALP